jgi:hypothetical protein
MASPQRLPETFILDAVLSGSGLAETATAAWAAWEAAGLPRVARWGLGGSSAPAGEAGSPVPAPAIGPGGLAFTTVEQDTGIFAPAGAGRISLQLPIGVAADPSSAVPAAIEATTTWLSEFGSRVIWASLRRGIGAQCLPHCLLAEPDAVLTWTNPADVLAGYVSVEAFRAAWSEVTEIGDALLAVRGADALDTVAWMTVAEPSQWALARAARAGRTTYRPATPLPEEEPLYYSGEPTLTPARYADGVLTYGAWTPPGTHVRGWEVHALLGLLADRVTPDGRPLDDVLVTFADEAAARREARPLLDVGAGVQFADDAGEVVPLTDLA